MSEMYQRSTDEVLAELETSVHGLSGKEAAERLARYGQNKLKEAHKITVFQRFLQQIKDPMLLILLAAAAVSAVTNAISGESFAEVFIILVVVLLNAILGVIQESKAEAAIEALQTMTAAKCKVMRDGKQIVIESSQLDGTSQLRARPPISTAYMTSSRGVRKRWVNSRKRPYLKVVRPTMSDSRSDRPVPTGSRLGLSVRR